jgi:tRNA modification GTPase
LATLLTPRGRGAIASIKFRGPAELLDGQARRLFVAANGKPLAAQPLDRILFGLWGSGPGEEVVVCRVGENLTEIHCHGGDAASRRILTDLATVGCRIVPWQQFESTGSNLFEAECREALTKAPTLRTAGILLDQLSGTLRSALEEIAESLRGGKHQPARSQISALLEWGEFGRHLTQPWQVVILGHPNAGKSSLMNSLAGYQRAIVFDQPGTTRDIVTAEIALNGWPVTLVDTAGIRQTDSALEAAGIALARDRALHADCRLLVLDASQPPHPQDFELLAAWPDALPVANKSDLLDAWGDRLPAGAHRVSALTGAGVETLAELLGNRLVPQVPLPGTAIPIAARQFNLLRQAHDAASHGDWGTCRNSIDEILRSRKSFE